jgi:hypothetical protein
VDGNTVARVAPSFKMAQNQEICAEECAENGRKSPQLVVLSHPIAAPGIPAPALPKSG